MEETSVCSTSKLKDNTGVRKEVLRRGNWI
jgi:hypothetical protein